MSTPHENEVPHGLHYTRADTYMTSDRIAIYTAADYSYLEFGRVITGSRVAEMGIMREWKSHRNLWR